MERLEWVIEYKGGYYINPQELHKNLLTDLGRSRNGS
jgi:hypothetical protein